VIRGRGVLLGSAILLATANAILAAERLRFWNLTTATITELRLAPTGTDQWGPNQCENDPDKAVDSDERLTITGVVPGQYDVKIIDKKGRTCFVRDIELQSGRPYAFSISDKDLTRCEP
jgi:hypothetical protein